MHKNAFSQDKPYSAKIIDLQDKRRVFSEEQINAIRNYISNKINKKQLKEICQDKTSAQISNKIFYEKKYIEKNKPKDRNEGQEVICHTEKGYDDVLKERGVKFGISESNAEKCGLEVDLPKFPIKRNKHGFVIYSYAEKKYIAENMHHGIDFLLETLTWRTKNSLIFQIGKIRNSKSWQNKINKPYKNRKIILKKYNSYYQEHINDKRYKKQFSNEQFEIVLDFLTDNISSEEFIEKIQLDKLVLFNKLKYLQDNILKMQIKNIVIDKKEKAEEVKQEINEEKVEDIKVSTKNIINELKEQLNIFKLKYKSLNEANEHKQKLILEKDYKIKELQKQLTSASTVSNINKSCYVIYHTEEKFTEYIYDINLDEATAIARYLSVMRGKSIRLFECGEIVFKK